MILIVQSLWNEAITDKLAEGAQKVLSENKLDTQVFRVPGALEIPLLIQWYSAYCQNQKKLLEGIVACGTIVRGETHHFEIVAGESARALTDLSLKLDVPIGNAILCVYHIDQALERAGGNQGHKGEEAAHAVMEMLKLKKRMSI